MRIATILVPLLLLGCTQAAAAPAGIVEGLQMPAWVERSGIRAPVRPAMVLEPGDRLRTGAGARLLLRLAEGSHVKLGENAEFRLDRLEPPASGGGAFRGFLDVIRGAFRYSTTLLSRNHRRELDVRVAGVTAGIRGTDLWGKAAADRDIVCLIEGRISVRHGDEAPFEMADPLSFYIAPKDGPPLPIAQVDPDKLAQWALETELAPGAGVLAAGGGWTLHLHAHRDSAASAAALVALHEAGYAAEVVAADVGGQTWHRVSINGLASAADARALGAELDGSLGISGPWFERTR